MKRRHALLISLAAGLAVIFGTVAATRSIQLGTTSATTSTVSPASIAKRLQAIDKAEIALRKALKQKPPKLPPLPTAAAPVPAASAPISAAVTAAPAPQRVIYVRPAPNVVTVHRSGGEHEGDDGHEGGSEHLAQGSHEGGGQFDD